MLAKIEKYLQKNDISYKKIHHKPTRTSLQSALARGEELSLGGKALVIKVGEQFKLFVLSAAKRVDSNSLRNYFNVKKIRFAKPQELKKLTGLVPGSVPPFGRPIVDLDLFVDHSILDNEKIAFNAGSLTDSLVMTVSDYLKVATPVIFNFSE